MFSTPPKGFENFFPRGRQNSRTSKKEEPKAPPDKKSPPSGGGGPSGGSGGGGNWFNSDWWEDMMKNRGNWWALGVSALIIYFLYYGPSGQRKEISWQEFRTKYLDTGEVNHLEVVNHSYVRVHLKSDSRAGASNLTFNIGSVDSFERNLEAAQKDLGIDPVNYIPVTYVSEAALVCVCIWSNLCTLHTYVRTYMAKFLCKYVCIFAETHQVSNML
jgi:AFG3 family protein